MSFNLGAFNSALNLTGGVLSSILGYAGQMESNKVHSQGIKDTNAQNLALQQQAWAREDNATQRKVADLESAGLSPVLAGGSGASSSSPIRLENPNSQYKNDPVQAISEAMQVFGMQANIKATDAQTANTKANTKNAELENAIYQVKLANDIESLRHSKLDNMMSESDAQKLFDIHGYYSGQQNKSLYGKTAGDVLGYMPTVVSGAQKGIDILSEKGRSAWNNSRAKKAWDKWRSR